VTANAPGDGWQARLIKPRLGLAAQANRPAEVSDLLIETLLARENLLEDAEYQKTVPNQFVVELAPDTYARYFAPLAAVLCQQWRDRLLNHLATANSRQGRREYHFAGEVTVAVRAAPDLAPGQLRIRSRVWAEAPQAAPPQATTTSTLPACLELLPSGKQWPLRLGTVTLGRDPACDVYLDLPRVQELRLVSSRHAYLHCSPDAYRLFDGSPGGQRSINGTFVNNVPVPATGQLLHDGDIVILAAVRPLSPSLETPGVVGLRFRTRCG